ncbi:MAG TPA: hypothetical protein VL992_14090 [Tepidisphaeraceae bacterium]|nr:hypothetical protein [Tepidisphaeraceae bacterium]
MSKRKTSAIDRFIALPDSEKERIDAELDAESPRDRVARSRPLTARERKQWQRFKSKIGRPKVGRGAKTISLTVELGLLKRADAYARRHGISRARLVADGLLSILASPASVATRNEKAALIEGDLKRR